MQAITIKLFIALILSTLLVACGGSSDDADSEIQDPVGNEGAKLSPDTPATNNPDATDDSESTDNSVPDGAEYTFASLPFDIADHAVDISRAQLYLTYKDEKKLVVIDLTDGSIEKELSFSYMPESLYLSKDGKSLFVALLHHEHSSYRWEEDQSGSVAKIDTETLAIESTFSVAIDPFDLVVTESGVIVISSGSGQWSEIHAYNVVNGSFIDKSFIRHKSYLALHPSGSVVYAADTDISPSDIEAFNISTSEISAAGDSPYHGDHRMNGYVWATPDGKYLITRGGDLFESPSMLFVGSITASNVYIENIAFDSEGEFALLALSTGQLVTLNLGSMQVVESITPSTPVLGAAGMDRQFVSITQALTGIKVTLHDDLCLACYDNEPPEAVLSASAPSGTTQTLFSFSAQESSDPEDGSDLMFRWDLDGDGEWDAPFSSSDQMEQKYLLAGGRSVSVQVKDKGGKVSTASVTISVSDESDAGVEITETEAATIIYSVTDFIPESETGKAYFTDKTANRFYVFNKETGLIEREFAFDYSPESIAITPDGSRVYIALLAHDHSSYRWEEDQFGYIAVFDTESQAIERIFEVALDPYDLVATDAGKLIISSGSGQWTDIYAYNADTGSVLGTAGIRHRSKLTLHPSQDYVFSANTDTSPSDIEKYDISGVGITELGDSPYHGDHRMSGNVWAVPGGDYLVTRGGDVYLASDMTYVKSLTGDGYQIEHLVFDTEQNLMFTVDQYGDVVYYNLTSLEFVGTLDTSQSVEWLYLHNGVVVTSSYTSVAGNSWQETPHPCPSCSDNTAPEAVISVIPGTSGVTSDTFVFSAEESTDAEGDEGLEFRWDTDGDGEWDTAFVSSPVIEKRYTLAGSRNVSLQVKDTAGAVDTASVVITVDNIADFGKELTQEEAEAVLIQITDSVTHDSEQKLYYTDKAAKKFYVLNQQTRLVEREFTFDLDPESLTITPDGSTVYIALLAHEHSSYRWEEDQFGYIAVFDTDTQAVLEIFEVATDPFDLVATDLHKLVISSGSGQWTDISVYNAETTSVLGTQQIRERSNITLHPQQQFVYSTEYSDIRKYDISGPGITLSSSSYYSQQGRVGDKVWVTPDGEYLISAGGDVFSASDLSFVQSMTPAGKSISTLRFDSARDLIFVVDSSGALAYYNSVSFEHIDTLTADQDIQGVYLIDNELVMLVTNWEGSTTLTSIEHPCLECADNTSPEAEFTVSSGTGELTTAVPVILDASTSSDVEDSDGLQFRWDINGDGEWDSEFSISPTFEHRFIEAGTKFVYLEVKDSLGLISGTLKTFTVESQVDFGIEIEAESDYALGFIPAEYEEAQNLLFVVNSANDRLYVMDPETGNYLKYFEFPYEITALTSSSAESELYVALAPQGFGYSRDESEQTGMVAIIDLTSLGWTRTVRVGLDPFDIVANDSGKLVVSSGSGQWTEIHAYDLENGNLLGTSWIRHRSYLSISPDGDTVFAADTDVSPSDIEAFDISGEGILRLGDSPYHGGYRMSGNVWADDSGMYVLTRGGDVFQANGLSFVHALIPTGVRVEAVLFDTDASLWTVLGDNDTAYAYNPTDWSMISSTADLPSPVGIFSTDSGRYLISSLGGGLLVEF